MQYFKYPGGVLVGYPEGRKVDRIAEAVFCRSLPRLSVFHNGAVVAAAPIRLIVPDDTIFCPANSNVLDSPPFFRIEITRVVEARLPGAADDDAMHVASFKKEPRSTNSSRKAGKRSFIMHLISLTRQIWLQEFRFIVKMSFVKTPGHRPSAIAFMDSAILV